MRKVAQPDEEEKHQARRWKGWREKVWWNERTSVIGDERTCEFRPTHSLLFFFFYDGNFIFILTFFSFLFGYLEKKFLSGGFLLKSFMLSFNRISETQVFLYTWRRAVRNPSLDFGYSQCLYIYSTNALTHICILHSCMDSFFRYIPPRINELLM